MHSDTQRNNLRAVENICSPDSCFIYFLYIYWRVNFSESFILPPTSCFIIIFTRDLSLLLLLFSAPGALTLHRIPLHSLCFSFITRPLSLFYLRLIICLLFFSPVCPLVSFTHYFIISLSSRCPYEFPAHVPSSIPPRELLTFIPFFLILHNLFCILIRTGCKTQRWRRLSPTIIPRLNVLWRILASQQTSLCHDVTDAFFFSKVKEHFKSIKPWWITVYGEYAFQVLLQYHEWPLGTIRRKAELHV